MVRRLTLPAEVLYSAALDLEGEQVQPMAQALLAELGSTEDDGAAAAEKRWAEAADQLAPRVREGAKLAAGQFRGGPPKERTKEEEARGLRERLRALQEGRVSPRPEE